MATLKQQIIRYRAKHNMSQRAFAIHAGISHATLVHIEKGSKRKMNKLTEEKIKIALEDETGGTKNELV